MPTLTQLEYIVSVEKLRHFGKAAKECHVSQPSLSAQIRKVEDELGFIIFDRLKKPILPTEKGRKLIDQAKIVLQEQKKLIDITKAEANTVSGHFRLGIIPTVAPYLLPLFIEAFSKSYPKVNLKIDELKTETILQELRDDILDGAILAGPIREGGLKENILYYEPFYLYVAKDSPMSRKKRISEDDLDGSDLWLLKDGHCLRNQVVKICSIRSEKNIFDNIHFEGGNLETLTYMVQKNHGYTLVPDLFVRTLSKKDQHAFIREFVQPVPTREISLIFRRNQWKSDILAAIEKTILENLPNDAKISLNKKTNHVVGI